MAIDCNFAIIALNCHDIKPFSARTKIRASSVAAGQGFCLSLLVLSSGSPVIPKFLNENLSFPFDGKIAQYQNKGPLQQGDKIRIHGLLGYEDGYGVIVKLRFGRKVYHFPLSDIETVGKTSENEKIIETYSEWFVNR